MKVNSQLPIDPATASQVSPEELRVRTFRSAECLPDVWDQLGGGDLFLSRSYLRALQSAPPQEMTFAYFLFLKADTPAGIAYAQLLPFDASKNIQSLEPKSLKRCLARALRFRLLVCGNLLLSGQHAFRFSPEVEDPIRHLAVALQDFADLEGIPGILIKDIPRLRLRGGNPFQTFGFHRSAFQPNMVLEIPHAWRQFSDYLAAMSSKYRVRARRARRRVAGIERRTLSSAQIVRKADSLYALYQEVASEADVNMLELHPDYLPNLASAFPERFRLTGYFKGGDLIGYRSSLENGEEREAHFLGFRRSENRPYDLYLNMLYDMVEEAIQGGQKRVVFSRTALEIKSSVGAEPEEMLLFLHARLAWFNPLIPLLVDWLEPRAVWQRRHPFRQRDPAT